MTTLQPGDPAPAFTLPDQDSRPVSLSDFAGRNLLVYFFPKADTAGCTKQSCAVRDALPDLTQAGTAAVGISPDPPSAQGKFDRKYGLGFPLLSDPDHSVAEAYGVWGEKSMYGRTYMGIVRSAFLVDEQGRIAGAWYKVSPGDTVPKALAALGA
ncbi:MAG TPA: thioredoxin-dependent thiol peroxidase [Actinomycetota bacterium]|nr:thioredoxin-dependent thiol peroxidase [Actinomycetota bacterium]